MIHSGQGLVLPSRALNQPECQRCSEEMELLCRVLKEEADEKEAGVGDPGKRTHMCKGPEAELGEPTCAKALRQSCVVGEAQSFQLRWPWCV